MDRRLMWAMVGIAVGIVVTAIVGAVYTAGYGFYGYGYSYGGQYPYGYPGIDGYGYQTYSINESLGMVMSVPSSAHVYPQNNTIVFTTRNIDLVVIAMMGDDARSMFNATAPPYAHGDVFVIYGLIDPTLVIPAGAVVHVTLINLDDDMYHNFVITTVPPPYPYYVMPYIGMYGGMGPQMMLYMRWLPPANYRADYAYGYQYTVVLNAPGTYWYLCTYPGHAEESMYGEIIVTGASGQPTAYQYPYGYPQYPYGYPGMGHGMMGW